MYEYILYFLGLFNLGNIMLFSTTNNQMIAASNTRYLVQNNIKGAFGLSYYKNSTYAYASIEDYAETYWKDGKIVFMLANISTTHKNLLTNPYGSFVIAPDNCSITNYNNMSYDPLACPRVTFTGEFYQLVGAVNTTNPYFISFYRKHPAALNWISSNVHDFNLWSMNVHDIYYIGGYGNLHYIGHIPTDFYFKSEPIKIV